MLTNWVCEHAFKTPCTGKDTQIKVTKNAEFYTIPPPHLFLGCYILTFGIKVICEKK